MPCVIFWSRISRWLSRSKANSASWPACRAAASKSLPRNPCLSRPKRTSATRSDLTKSESDGRILLRRKRETAHPAVGGRMVPPRRAVPRPIRPHGCSGRTVSHQQRRFPGPGHTGDFPSVCAAVPRRSGLCRPMGRDRLKSELMAKGLGETLADDAIVDGLDGLDEETLARRALRLKGRG